LRKLGVRGRTRLWWRNLQVHAAFGTAQAVGATARLRNSLLGRGDRCGETAGAGEERTDRSLRAAGRLARLGDDGRLGADQQNPSRHRDIAVAEVFRFGGDT